MAWFVRISLSSIDNAFHKRCTFPFDEGGQNTRYLQHNIDLKYHNPFKFRLPLIFASRGSEIKRERIWNFCIEMLVILKGGEL